MVLTQAEEFAATGSWSTGVFQILSAGSTGQFPIAGDCAAAAATAPAISTMTRSISSPIARNHISGNPPFGGISGVSARIGRMRNFGLIGGLGPLATIHYYRELARAQPGEILI